jgi:hypothetical protein
MRSWLSRGDTYVCDEPFYAHYLIHVDVDHPGRDEVLAAQENDWRKVAEWLSGEVPDGKAIFYQKHMAHHLLPNMGREWLAGVMNAFLIREPREMLTSLIKVTPNAGVDDTGLPQQVELFSMVREKTGEVPPVIDAREVLDNPRGVLSAFCDSVGVTFTEEMLSWEAGPRASDGVWAKYWYAAVEKSTGFQPYQSKDEAVPDALKPVLDECQRHYDQLYVHRITA